MVLVLQWFWSCRGGFDFGIVVLALQWWFWSCNGRFCLAMVLTLQWFWSCSRGFGFAVVWFGAR